MTSFTLVEPVFWNWLILGCIFFLFELFTISFFFIFWAIASLIVAAITFLMPQLSWQWQGIYFAIFSLLSLLLWWKLVSKKWQNNNNDESSLLNNRVKSLIGRKFILTNPIKQCYGQLQIDDTIWTIKGDDMSAGTEIIIVSAVDTILNVEKIN